MKYNLIKNTVDLLEDFEQANLTRKYSDNIEGFQKWIVDKYSPVIDSNLPEWEGKEIGRSAESVISTLLVHMNRFAKSYSKAAIIGSQFSTQEDFIYLINLKAFGKMTKMDLIKKNVHEKSVGILIINRLMGNGWIVQENSLLDKRSKIIGITASGLQVLDLQMAKIRKATQIVSGNLNEIEKSNLISLLTKLNDFHLNIYEKNIAAENLLEEVSLHIS